MSYVDLLVLVFYPKGGLDYGVITTKNGAKHSKYKNISEALADGWEPISATETHNAFRRPSTDQEKRKTEDYVL